MLWPTNESHVLETVEPYSLDSSPLLFCKTEICTKRDSRMVIIRVGDGVDVHLDWSTQKLIKVESNLNHNYTKH